MMGIGQAITIPFFFASSAIYPIALMPPWLRFFALINPLTYVVDALRALMLPGYQANLLLDVVALLIALCVFVALASIGIKRLIN